MGLCFLIVDVDCVVYMVVYKLCCLLLVVMRRSAFVRLCWLCMIVLCLWMVVLARFPLLSELLLAHGRFCCLLLSFGACLCLCWGCFLHVFDCSGLCLACV